MHCNSDDETTNRENLRAEYFILFRMFAMTENTLCYATGLDAGHRSCIRHSAAADGVVPALLAVRVEVLVVVLLAVVGARLVRARNDRVAVVCQCQRYPT